MSKIISSLSIDTSNLPPTRSVRKITITGTPGAAFSLMIRNEDDANQLLTSLPGYDPNHYFRPVTGAIKGALKNVVLPSSGVFSFNQVFPAVSDDDYYDITIKEGTGTTLSNSIPRNYDSTGIEKATYRLLQYSDAGRATFTLSGDITGGPAWYLPFPANVVVNKPVGQTTAPVKIHWNIRCNDTITVSRQPRFSTENANETDFSGSAPVVRSVFDAVNNNTSVILSNDSNGVGTADLSAGMIVTGGNIEDKITIESVDDSKTITLTAPITADGGDETGVYADFDANRPPSGTQLYFSSGGASVEFSTFKVSDPYTFTSAAVNVTSESSAESFVDFDAEGIITFGNHDFTYTLALDNFLTLS